MGETKQNPNRRTATILIATALIVGSFVFGIQHLRRRAQLNQEQSKHQRRQSSFDAVKSGDSTAWVMDSKLLPMLANDIDCQRNVTGLDFTSTEIDAEDAIAVVKLKNVTSMTFYCTTGTEHVLRAAKGLPITKLYFEMPDITGDSYLLLMDYPELEYVRF